MNGRVRSRRRSTLFFTISVSPASLLTVHGDCTRKAAWKYVSGLFMFVSITTMAMVSGLSPGSSRLPLDSIAAPPYTMGRHHRRPISSLVSIIRTVAIRRRTPAGAHRLMPGQLYAQATHTTTARIQAARNRQSAGQLRLPHCLPPTPGRPSAPHGPFPCSRSQSRWCFIATSMMCASSSPRWRSLRSGASAPCRLA